LQVFSDQKIEELDVNLDGTWINQNGSTVEFLTDAAGRLSGTYRSRKGRAAVGRAYPLSGQVCGEVAAFQVCWRDDEADLGAVTSFTGRFGRDADGTEILHTIWVLARQWENEERTRPTGVWNAFLTNADVFRRPEE
jgi:hypothetical protein